jgi:hypothetical protein
VIEVIGWQGVCSKVTKGNTLTLNYASFGSVNEIINLVRTLTYVDDTHYDVGGCDISNGTQNNNACIPYMVIGYKL